MSVQQLKKQLLDIAESPRRFEPDMMKRARRLFSQIFIAEHPHVGNGTMMTNG
jgi:hypothetical protein